MKVLFIAVLLAVAAHAGDVVPKLNWVAEVHIPYWQYAVCLDERYLYLAATVEGGVRVEKRLKESGQLLKATTLNMSIVNDCVVSGDYVYLVGGRHVEGWVMGVVVKIDKELNVRKLAESGPFVDKLGPVAADSDGEYLYVLGQDFLQPALRVERRRLDDLSLVDSYTADLAGNVRDLAVNPSTGELWALDGAGTARVLILRSDLTAVRRFNVNIWASAIVFDRDGYAYLIGSGVAKLNSTGGLVAFNKDVEGLGAVVSGGALYVSNTAAYIYVLNCANLSVEGVIAPLGGGVRPSRMSAKAAVADDSDIYMAFPNALFSLRVRPLDSAARSTLVVVAVDGFGQIRYDWLIKVGDSYGAGVFKASVPRGGHYVVEVITPLVRNATMFVAAEDEHRLTVKIPTGKLTARVINHRGLDLPHWRVEVPGIASGYGQLGPLEVLAGTYVVKASYQERSLEQVVHVEPGRVANATFVISTAHLEIRVTDKKGNSPTRRVVVKLNGREVESPILDNIPTGFYLVEINAPGYTTSFSIYLSPGEVRALHIVLPDEQPVTLLLVALIATVVVSYFFYLLCVERLGKPSGKLSKQF
ncbi:MAG: hypothetical protein QXP31_07745 [Pyrobaculum sp.]